MTRAHAVIGAGFGDEGKGLMVDYFCRKFIDRGENTIVVRHSGGAQAGHTVNTADGIRHVFCHHGAGSLAGAPTLLSEHFVVNPIVWLREHYELKQKIKRVPTTLFHNKARLSIPADIAINRMLEESRGDKRHGSVGLGINETMQRCMDPNLDIATYVRDVNMPDLVDRLRNINAMYVPRRLDALGLRLNPEIEQWLTEYTQYFVTACQNFSKLAYVVRDYEDLRNYHKVVFEGSQGLLLDQDHRFFPHVTHAKTGIRNVEHVLGSVHNTAYRPIPLEVTYVTRAYMTRHGAGPFPTERKKLKYDDATNVTHQFQGKLRFGILDVDLICDAIKNDRKPYFDGDYPKAGLAITCIDQVPPEFQIQFNGRRKKVRYQQLADLIGHGMLNTMPYHSFGPMAKDVI